MACPWFNWFMDSSLQIEFGRERLKKVAKILDATDEECRKASMFQSAAEFDALVASIKASR